MAQPRARKEATLLRTIRQLSFLKPMAGCFSWKARPNTKLVISLAIIKLRWSHLNCKRGAGAG